MTQLAGGTATPWTFVAWGDPSRPIWGMDWPYQVRHQFGATTNASIPPGSSRTPLFWNDPQRPIWGETWQYGYRLTSSAPASSVTGPTAPPPGQPWGTTGAAAPELEIYGYYDPWPAQRAAQIASLITPPFVPGPPPSYSIIRQTTIRNWWAEDTWQPPPFTAIATLQPPPPATNPPPQSTVLLFQLRLSWEEPTWNAQTGGFIGDLPQPPPPPPIPPPLMPNVVGLLLWEGIALLEADGIVNTASLGYFSTFPVSVIWVPIPASGLTTLSGGEEASPSGSGPGLILAQSPAVGQHIDVNGPIVLTCYEYPKGVTFP